MPYQCINEIISVVGIYKNYTFIPHKFKWNQKIYPINQVTLTSNVKDGGVKKRLYSVVSQSNTYRLEFNRDTETWYLLEVWVE